MPTPNWKIFNAHKEYVGCMKDPADAAAMASILGEGATVKFTHRILVWTEGGETFSAGESYDEAARVMEQRRAEASRAGYDLIYGEGAYDRAMAETTT